MDDFQHRPPQRFRATNKQRDEEKKRKSGSSGGIPDRWLDYLGVNVPIESTRFIAFKCPLKPEMQRHLTIDQRFTLADLVERIDDQGKELGLIIDLTNTDRYYKATDIADAQMEYHKIMTPGHNRIPSDPCYEQFVNIVRSFLERNRHNDKLIGVHCTHGLNRTGYLVVRYMIEYMSIQPNDALEAFNRARGHSMEKYTEDLLKRTFLDGTTRIETNNLHSENTDKDEVKWPTFSSTFETMSLNHRQKNNQAQTTKTATSSARYGNHSFRVEDYQSNQRPFRQTSVAPRALNASDNESQASTYFGSGSNVGRGRPLTGDRQ